MRTFYIAGPGEEREEISIWGDSLKDCGLKWAFDWTRVNASHIDLPFTKALDLQRHGLVCADIGAAVSSDLFIYRASHYGISLGASAEFGARLASGKPSVVILNGANHHPFFDHFSVEVFEDFTKFFLQLGLT